MLKPEDILDFWLTNVGPRGWYAGGAALDADIRARFEPLWEAAVAGKSRDWMTGPRLALAYIVLLDQFPRNMFRGTARAFSSDKQARTMTKLAIDHGWDMQVPEPERQFFYLPLMHSECLADQERAVRLFLTRMPETGADNLEHAKAHREIIRQFARFPARNKALARKPTGEETRYLDAGGYRKTLAALDAVRPRI